MAITIHTISRYTVQVLTRKVGENAHSYITVRLYDHDNACRGVAVFENYGGAETPKPTGDYEAQSVVAYLDVAHYAAYMDILRLEKPVYLKISWTQHGKARSVSHVSIDTKKEVIGEYFGAATPDR
jgi:hypothetical protein